MGPIVRAVIGYFFLLAVVRVLTRRPGAQLAPFEYVLVFFIGGIIIQSVVGDDRSMTNAVCTVVTVGLMHRVVGHFKRRHPMLRKLVDGTPLVLLRDGKWQVETMHKMRLDDSDVMAAARATRGIRTIDRIKYAVVERNGLLTIVPKDENDEEEKEA